MFKPSDDRGCVGCAGSVRAVVTVMLLAPLMAWPIVTTTESAEPAQPGSTSSSGSVESVSRAAVPVPAPAKPVGNYQIRCWQYGRLLFEENHVALPDMARYGLRIGGTDATGRPLYVAETQHATCLIRPAAAERPWPR
jgi:hypothetical protein